MRYLFLLIGLVVILSAERIPFEQIVNETKKQISSDDYNNEYVKYKRYILELQKIKNLSDDILNIKKNRHAIIEQLNRIRQFSNSLIISNIQVNKGVEWFGIANKDNFEKYISPALEIVYSKRLCSGFIFKGQEYILEKDYKSAIDIYKTGLTHCTKDKVLWKHQALKSRLNIANHKMKRKER